jgi:voltage-gated potassium channel
MQTPHDTEQVEHEQQAQRWRVLSELEDWLERPMILLGVIWFCLVIVELVWASSRIFDLLGTAIWIIFIGEFALRFALAPNKARFLKGNVITVLALVAPALRFLRVVRLLRVARGLRLVRIVGTANRSIAVLGRSFGRRGLGYVFGITVLLALLGAAGMLAFEPATQVQGGFESYADALWWTAMLISTMGSGYWPQTAEGRVLTLLLSFYGFAVFGYITASLATFFIGQEARARDSDVAGASDVTALRAEMALLRTELGHLRER